MNIGKKMSLYKMALSCFSCLLLHSNYSMQNFEMEINSNSESIQEQNTLEAQEIKKINNIFKQAQLKLEEYHKNLQANAVDLWNTIPQYNSMSKEEFENLIKDENSCLLSSYVGGPKNFLPKDYVENLEEYMPVFFNHDFFCIGEPILSKKEQFYVRFYFYDQLLKKNNGTIADFSMMRLKLINYVKNNQINIVKDNLQKKSIALGKLTLRNSFFTAMKNKIIINSNIDQQRKNNLRIFKAKNTLFKKLLQKRAQLQEKKEAAEKDFVRRRSIKKKIRKLSSIVPKPIKQKKEKRPLMQSDRKTREKKPVNYKKVNSGK